jgi:hypothetical protein
VNPIREGTLGVYVCRQVRRLPQGRPHEAGARLALAPTGAVIDRGAAALGEAPGSVHAAAREAFAARLLAPRRLVRDDPDIAEVDVNLLIRSSETSHAQSSNRVVPGDEPADAAEDLVRRIAPTPVPASEQREYDRVASSQSFEPALASRDSRYGEELGER